VNSIPLPPLPEQRKIAQILETVDNAIEKTEKIIEKYKRIKQGLMQDLLTKGIDEKGNIRSEKTHKFKDSPLGRIPEEWEVVRLGEVGEIMVVRPNPKFNIMAKSLFLQKIYKKKSTLKIR
jgi:type I restriction enzyme S subunit